MLTTCPRQAAANQFLLDHLPLLHYLIGRTRLHPNDDADDVFGDLCVAVLKAHHTYRHDLGRPGTWIGYVLRTVLHHRKARASAKCRAGTTVSIAAEQIDVADARAADPAMIAEDRDLIAWAARRKRRRVH